MSRAKQIRHPQFELTTRGRRVFLVCHEEYWTDKGERKYSEPEYQLDLGGAPGYQAWSQSFPMTRESLRQLYRDLGEFIAAEAG